MNERLNGKITIMTNTDSRNPNLKNKKTTTILFTKENTQMLYVDQMKDHTEETTKLIRTKNNKATTHTADITRTTECTTIIKTTIEQWNNLNILHNNIGIESHNDLLDTSEAEWDHIINIDLKSIFLTTQTTIPTMLPHNGSTIICISSITALHSYKRTTYTTTKTNMIGFIHSIAIQLGPKRIRMNAIAPKPVWTPMIQNLNPDTHERRQRASPLTTENTNWDVN